VYDDAGHPVRVVGVHADITERKLAEAVLREEIEARGRVERALRASQERCAKAFRTSPDAISIERRADGHFIEVNERWVSLLGFTAEEAIGHTRDDLRIESCENEWAHFDCVLAVDGCVRDFELNVRNNRGEILRVVVASETVDVGGEECFITMMRDVSPALMERACEIACLGDVIAGLPEGLDTLIGERGYALSGGERQRVGIARALCRNAPILLLDEATSALDSATEQLVMRRLMVEHTGDRTMLIVAHRISTLKDADKIVVFDQGRVVEQGRFQDLAEDPESRFGMMCAIQST